MLKSNSETRWITVNSIAKDVAACPQCHGFFRVYTSQGDSLTNYNSFIETDPLLQFPHRNLGGMAHTY